MQETWVRAPEEGNGNRSSILAWRIPWTEELGGLLSMELKRTGHEWATNTFTFFFFSLQKVWFFIWSLILYLKFEVCLWKQASEGLQLLRYWWGGWKVVTAVWMRVRRKLGDIWSMWVCFPTHLSSAGGVFCVHVGFLVNKTTQNAKFTLCSNCFLIVKWCWNKYFKASIRGGL